MSERDFFQKHYIILSTPNFRRMVYIYVHGYWWLDGLWRIKHLAFLGRCTWSSAIWHGVSNCVRCFIVDNNLHRNVFIKMMNCKTESEKLGGSSVGETACSHVEQMNARDEYGSDSSVSVKFSWCVQRRHIHTVRVCQSACSTLKLLC